jgi:hypothetical protein
MIGGGIRANHIVRELNRQTQCERAHQGAAADVVPSQCAPCQGDPLAGSESNWAIWTNG